MKKDDEIIYENNFNGCNFDHKVHIYSVTKSIVSLLIGIAIDQGHIQSVKQKINDYYPCKYDITIQDLLTMSVHYKFIITPYIKYFKSQDYVQFALNYITNKKLGKFSYAPLIGLDILSGIITKATKMSVLEFAKKNLFEPLDIHIKDPIVFKDKEDQMNFNNSLEYNGWVSDSNGTNTAGWGLTLSAKDLLKIGKCLLNEGNYLGKKIISKKWIDECTSCQNVWEKRKLKYGYLFWVDDDGFSAMGDGGNILYVNKNKRLIVAMTGYYDRNSKDRIDFIKKYIEG